LLATLQANRKNMAGFWDFLKGFLPDSFIKVINDNRKIIVKDTEITVGNKTINDPETLSKFFNAIANFKESESFPFQIIHQDLFKDYVDYENVSIQEKQSLSLLKENLSSEEIECILMARRVHLAFNKNDKDLAKNLLEQLEKNYPSKGKKVFNLIHAGYFDELIIPMISICKAQYSTNSVEKFREFYNDILKFFPTAIFVSNNVDEESIKKEILKRLRLKRIPFIKIHSIGQINVEKVEKVISSLKEEKKGKFSITDNRFVTPSGMSAQVLIISIVKNFT